mmetsp:Transcript_11805/g.32700  ORF Transcript_11805/g.32700 Transcript_11805/m.32700 type:complete len:204 (+) Transcript_11805:756-1367(+)
MDPWSPPREVAAFTDVITSRAPEGDFAVEGEPDEPTPPPTPPPVLDPSSSSSSSSRLFSPYVGLVPTAHQSFPWNPGRKPCSSALNRSRAKDEKLGSCGGFLRSTTLTPDSPVSTPSALSSGYAYASPSRTPAPADDRCVNSSALSSQLPWKNTVRANWSNCADVRLFPRKPALSSFGSAKNVPKKLRICSIRSDISSSIPNW